MKINTKAFLLLAVVGLVASCDSFMDPLPENIYDDQRIIEDAPFAEGLLLTAYAGLPSAYSFDEIATDDAVSNDESSPFRRIAVGEWSSQFNPAGVWDGAYEQIYYLNLFLGRVNEIEWSWESEERDIMFRNRFTGEARALRAYYNFRLLLNHGGVTSGGEPLGFVVLTPEILEGQTEDVGQLPRSSYAECVQFILDDITSAISLLPSKYEDSEDINYTQVFGSQNENRVNGTAAKALKARVMLHAASQPFNTGVTMADAANAAATVLQEIGGVAGMSASGVRWYNDEDDADIIWRRDFVNINSWEQANFPPSLFGNGRTNPSQNFVDAFPMLNGYPIDHAASGYDAANPYANRDPRLAAYVVFNGNTIGANAINTSTAASLDGLNNSEAATRTGYYLKKLLRENVNLNPNINSTQIHFYTFFRYTEMFLIYAEAANEAWGPDSDPSGYGYTARDVVRALRARAGIGQPDEFLDAAASQDAMRDLIRNERRIELSFEGFRFWDLRRWGMDLDETVQGVRIDAGTHTVIDVESRGYQPYMNYGPIPYEEILRDQNLVQNSGW